MKYLNKSILATAMLSASIATTTAMANQAPAQPQAPQFKPQQAQAKQFVVSVDPKLNAAAIKRTYPLLEIKNVDKVPELKKIKFDFEELLKANVFINENYGKKVKQPEFNFVNVSASLDKTIKAKVDKMNPQDRAVYVRTLNQAMMQAPVLAYYDYLTTGTVATQKNIYDLVQYQNKRFGKVALPDLQVATTGKSDDVTMALLLNRIALPFDANAALAWYNAATQMNKKPVKLDKPVSYGTLFVNARTNFANAKKIEAEKAKATAPAAPAVQKETKK